MMSLLNNTINLTQMDPNNLTMLKICLAYPYCKYCHLK